MSTKQDILFTPFNLNGMELRNRCVMAPLTRNRATHGTDVPRPLNVEYYSQRAGDAGLIITEATQISPTGKGYAWTPGIYSAEQVAGWRAVTDAVHAKGGRIYLQLWHVGRVSHPSLQPGGVAPVAPSAIAPVGASTLLETGQMAEIGTPRALATEELAGIVADYRHATRNAIKAGFDGVEIHAANGYLLNQFLSDNSNKRDDEYGGSVENRMRFVLEVIDAVTSEIGGDRTGIRISPAHRVHDVMDSDPASVYFPLMRALNKYKMGYVHVIARARESAQEHGGFDFHALRKEFKGAWIVCNGYNFDLATEAVASGYADLVAFGKLYIANPDLAKRFKQNAPLNKWDSATFYGGDAKGYTDYPAL